MSPLNEDIVSKIPKDLIIRCICRQADVESLGLENVVEGPLTDVFKGHQSWNEPLLAEYCTVMIPVPKLLQLGESGHFSLASYRWKNVLGDEIFDGRKVYIPANYGWFLEELPPGTAGWMDFISHRQLPYESRTIVELMGYFYASFEVIPSYLKDDATRGDLMMALSRGWIAQESTFVKISQPILHRWVRRVLDHLPDQLAPTGNTTFGIKDEYAGKETLQWLLSFAARRCRLPEVTQILVDWLGIEDKSDMLVKMEHAKRGDWEGVRIAFAWRSNCLDGIKTSMPLVDEEVVSKIAYLLATPREPDLDDVQVCTGIIRTFSETQFTYPMDEVVGSLAVVGVMTGYGPPAIGERQRNGGLPSKEEVAYANNLLGRCLRKIINVQEDTALKPGVMMRPGSGAIFKEFKISTYRLTPGLVLSGLGYLSGEGPCPFLNDDCVVNEKTFQQKESSVASLVEEEDGKCKCEVTSAQDIDFKHIQAEVEWSDGPLQGVEGWSVAIDFVTSEPNNNMGQAFYVKMTQPLFYGSKFAKTKQKEKSKYFVKGTSNDVDGAEWGFH